MTEPVVHETHVRIGREPGRRAERIAIVAIVVLFVAMVKPWGPGPVDENAGRRQQPIVEPTERISYVDLPCSGARHWLIEADERWAGHIVRTWVHTEAVEAGGPTDPVIPFIVVAAELVLAIGYCPASRDDRRPHTALTIHRLLPRREVVATVAVTVPQFSNASENVLFRPAVVATPAGTRAAGPASWTAGRYVMQIEGSDGYERWLGFDIRLISVGPTRDTEAAEE